MRRGLWSSFLVPPGLWLVALYLVPLGLIVAASFGTVDFLGRVIYSWPFAGWDLSNYHTVLTSAYLPAFFRSLAFAALTTLLCLLIGYPVAYVIARYGGRVRHLLVVLLVLPWFVDYLIRIYAWIVLLGDNGVVNGWLGDLGMSGDPPVQFLGTWWAVVGGLFYSYFPFMVLPIYAAVDRMDSSLVEAGKDLYGTPWQTFRHVTFPATFQGVVAGAVLVFLPASGDFANAEFLGSPEHVDDRQRHQRDVQPGRLRAARRHAHRLLHGRHRRVHGVLPALGRARLARGRAVSAVAAAGARRRRRGFDRPRFLWVLYGPCACTSSCRSWS